MTMHKASINYSVLYYDVSRDETRVVDKDSDPSGPSMAEIVAHAEFLASAYPDCRVTVRDGFKLLLAIEVEDWGVAPTRQV